MTCTICINTFKNPFATKCGHTFCNKCIMTWVFLHNGCPLCRENISQPTDFEDEEEEDEEEDRYVLRIYGTKLSKEETKELNRRICDYLTSLNKPMAIYQWREAANGSSSYTMIRKNTYYIDLKFVLIRLKSQLYKIKIDVSKRDFIKYRNKYKL